MRPDALGGQYLDPRAARAAVEAVRKQGRAARPAAVQIQDAVLTRHVLRRIR
jgi:hypothetical protein